MNTRELEAAYTAMAEAYAALLAMKIIARIQDESRFYHFWRAWDEA
jgi:hypothetical protein